MLRQKEQGAGHIPTNAASRSKADEIEAECSGEYTVGEDVKCVCKVE